MRFLRVDVTAASPSQNAALAILPKFPSFISFWASTYIVYDIFRIYRKHPKSIKTYHRLLVGLSFCDAISSLAWFCTTWPIPHDVFPIYGASGTQGTCTLQGFFGQLSIAPVIYNAGLALYYCLVVKFGWTDRRIHNSKMEIFVHIISLSFAFGTATAGVILGLFNPLGWDCWIASVPLNCEQSWLNKGETTCVRGDNALFYQWLFFYGPLWIISIFVSVAMYLVYSSFKKQFDASQKWQRRTGSSPSQAQIQKKQFITSQATLYVANFVLVWCFPTILRIHQITSDVVYYHWVLLSAMFSTMQGAWNMYIYLRPRIIMNNKKRKEVKKQKDVSGGTATGSTNEVSYDKPDLKQSPEQDKVELATNSNDKKPSVHAIPLNDTIPQGNMDGDSKDEPEGGWLSESLSLGVLQESDMLDESTLGHTYPSGGGSNYITFMSCRGVFGKTTTNPRPENGTQSLRPPNKQRVSFRHMLHNTNLSMRHWDMEKGKKRMHSIVNFAKSVRDIIVEGEDGLEDPFDFGLESESETHDEEIAEAKNTTTAAAAAAAAGEEDVVSANF